MKIQKNNKRQIVVVWKFVPKSCGNEYDWIADKDIRYRVIEVEGNDCLVCAVLLSTQFNTNMTKKTLEFANDRASNKNFESLVLLHHRPKSYINNHINDGVLNVKFELFSRGSGTIYTELLHHETCFQEKIFKNGKIKSEVFNIIWDHYAYRNKYTLLHDFLALVVSFKALKESCKSNNAEDIADCFRHIVNFPKYPKFDEWLLKELSEEKIDDKIPSLNINFCKLDEYIFKLFTLIIDFQNEHKKRKSESVSIESINLNSFKDTPRGILSFLIEEMNNYQEAKERLLESFSEETISKVILHRKNEVSELFEKLDWRMTKWFSQFKENLLVI